MPSDIYKSAFKNLRVFLGCEGCMWGGLPTYTLTTRNTLFPRDRPPGEHSHYPGCTLSFQVTCPRVHSYDPSCTLTFGTGVPAWL